MELTGEENLDSVARQASSFGTAAAAYAEHRPGYAEAAVRWAVEPVSTRAPLRILDLAAGTGKLTATLVRLAAEVTAVEPDPAMLAELRRELGSVPALRALTGTAEQIPRREPAWSGWRRRVPVASSLPTLQSSRTGSGGPRTPCWPPSRPTLIC